MAVKDELPKPLQQPDISVQIVNYKTKQYLGRCLEGILDDLDNSALSWDIQILENGSGEDLTDVKKRFENRGDLDYHYNYKNVGFGSGHNMLADNSNSRAILVLNPDTQVTQPQTIARLYNRLSSDTKIVGPKLKDTNGKTQLWDHGKTLFGNPGFNFWKERTSPLNVEWVSGACMMVERRIFEQLGGFDPNLFLYLEDNDICHRAIAKGKKVLYDPTIEMMHHSGVVANKQVEMPKSMTYFLQKYRGEMGPLIYWAHRANIKFFNRW